MTIIPASAAAVAAAPLPVAPASLNKASAIASAAQDLLLHLARLRGFAGFRDTRFL
jgi:hypothetical protein